MADRNRRYSVAFSGALQNGENDNKNNDGRMKVKYLYVFSDASLDVSGSMNYSDVFPLSEQGHEEYKDSTPMMFNYTSDNQFDVTMDSGVYALSEAQGTKYSFYRREYELYQDQPGEEPTVFAGPWAPVAVQFDKGYFRDYNIANNKSYQYIMYPADNSKTRQIFANYDEPCHWDPEKQELDKYDFKDSAKSGRPIVTKWDEWSIVELIPEEVDVDTPTVQGKYRANLDQMWLFKYSLETGSQTQNISRNEFQTLGQFPKIGFGASNYASGEVSALLGSEIIPYSAGGYIERLKGSRVQPLSTNERIKMLQQWQALVASKNPKLLKDIKGQTWIVQIMSSSNNAKNFYLHQPDTISFSWKQVADTKDVIIYGDVGNLEENKNYGKRELKPMFKNNITK